MVNSGETVSSTKTLERDKKHSVSFSSMECFDMIAVLDGVNPSVLCFSFVFSSRNNVVSALEIDMTRVQNTDTQGIISTEKLHSVGQLDWNSSLDIG